MARKTAQKDKRRCFVFRVFCLRDADMSRDLYKALADMEIVGETFGFIEKRIYWEFEHLKQRVNTDHNPEITKALRLQMSDFLQNLAQNIEEENDLGIQ